MRTTYIDHKSWAVADVSQITRDFLQELVNHFNVPDIVIGFKCHLINRVNVPKINRGQGYGRYILQQVLNDADDEKVVLFLWINPYGEMTYEELAAWYIRNGFTAYCLKDNECIYVRMPN